MSDATTDGALRAPHTVAFSYERSLGGATERFLRGLAHGEVLGSRLADSRVVVPPVDHDPVTGAPALELVRVAATGTVQSWTWVAAPGPRHPLDRPFAFALVLLDGADTAWLHVVDAGDETAMATGMRVRADWRAERRGNVLDLRAFVPDDAEEGASGVSGAPPSSAEQDEQEASPAPVVVDDVRLGYVFEPGLVLSSFYRGLAVGRIEGGRCETCAKVFVPPHAHCPACGTGPMTPTSLPDVGTVDSVAVVHLPVHGFDVDLPFAWAWIRLDGADVPFAHLLGGVAPADVQVGQRVQAVWEPADDRPASWEAIAHFRPVTA